jgi:hypothetical protein
MRGGKGRRGLSIRGNHEVGYARPPLHSRFKKGQSGNPKGRPRVVTLNRRSKKRCAAGAGRFAAAVTTSALSRMTASPSGSATRKIEIERLWKTAPADGTLAALSRERLRHVPLAADRDARRFFLRPKGLQ